MLAGDGGTKNSVR